MLGNNYTQALEDRQVPVPGRYRKVWDFNVGVGGPIVDDRLWFFGSSATKGANGP